jgi:hypothetical protein
VSVTEYRYDNTGIFYKTWDVNNLARLSVLKSATYLLSLPSTEIINYNFYVISLHNEKYCTRREQKQVADLKSRQ